MRITIKNEKALNITSTLSAIEDDLKRLMSFDDDAYDNLQELLETMQKEYEKPTSRKKQLAARKATNTREEQAKDKIRNAVNMMNLQNKKINVNSVSRESGVAYNTVKKYGYLLIKID